MPFASTLAARLLTAEALLIAVQVAAVKRAPRHPMSSDERTRALDAMVAPAGTARAEAHEEMADGQKEGHWIWWVFPTLTWWRHVFRDAAPSSRFE